MDREIREDSPWSRHEAQAFPRFCDARIPLTQKGRLREKGPILPSRKDLQTMPPSYSYLFLRCTPKADEAGIEKEPVPTPVALSDSALVIVGG